MSARAELWNVKGGLEVRRGRSSRTPAVAPPNFVGDPGTGKFYGGWALGPGNGSVNAARVNLGWPGDSQISVIHNYSSATNAVPSMSMIDEAHNNGMIASQSFKMTGWSWAAIVSGAADAAIDTAAAGCIARAPKPIWLCCYHEPEDIVDTTNYRAAYRRIVLRFRAAGVTNVSWMPIHRCPYNFISSYGWAGTNDWRNWHADWTGTTWQNDLTMDMFGLDVYNPLPGATGSHTFASMVEGSISVIESAGQPQWDYVIPEFGMSYHAAPLPNWLTWCTDAAASAASHKVKAFCYWDNSTDPSRYSFDAVGDPDGTKLQGWRYLTARTQKAVF